MIKLENFEVMGWEHAIRGMRNPMNSWDKSDSCCLRLKEYGCDYCSDKECDARHDDNKYCELGPNDHDLMMKLRNAGTDHRKFMRMIAVYVDITAPLYWWKEFDTYKVGTVANSCSTMHKIHAEPFKLDQFSHEYITGWENGEEVFELPCANSNSDDLYDDEYDDEAVLDLTIIALNHYRNLYLKTNDKKYWYKMIQLLPSSYNQKRTIMFNYEVLANIYKSRKNHKLDEWRELCKWTEGLPYSELITYSKEETSFQEDLDFFVNDCTNAQLKQLYERIGEKIKEKGL